MKKLNKKPMKEEYPLIENPIEASSIKSRKFNTTAVLLTFNLVEQAYKIYIPGQQSDVAVCKYQYWP